MENENKKENLERKVWKIKFFQRKVGEMLFDEDIEAHDYALNFLNSKNLSPENVKIAYRKNYNNQDVVAIYYRE